MIARQERHIQRLADMFSRSFRKTLVTLLNRSCRYTLPLQRNLLVQHATYSNLGIRQYLSLLPDDLPAALSSKTQYPPVNSSFHSARSRLIFTVYFFIAQLIRSALLSIEPFLILYTMRVNKVSTRSVITSNNLI